MPDDSENRLDQLDKAVFGDRNDPKGSPGLIADQLRMGQEQARTNEILMEMRDALKRINWIILTAVATAVLSLVVRH